MFQKLRNKVNAVLPDIESIYISSAASLSTVSSPLKTINPLSSFATNSGKLASNDLSTAASAASSLHWPNTQAINFNAGCALLQRNEGVWKDIHAANETNASKAAECDRLISGIKESIAKHANDLVDINVSMEQIPNILRTVANCSAVVGDISRQCADVEEQLYELEDLLEVLELQEKQLDRKFEMAMFKERKLGEYRMKLLIEKRKGFRTVALDDFKYLEQFHSLVLSKCLQAIWRRCARI